MPGTRCPNQNTQRWMRCAIYHERSKGSESKPLLPALPVTCVTGVTLDSAQLRFYLFGCCFAAFIRYESQRPRVTAALQSRHRSNCTMTDFFFGASMTSRSRFTCDHSRSTAKCRRGQNPLQRAPDSFPTWPLACKKKRGTANQC
jgi:hypothetical protein